MRLHSARIKTSVFRKETPYVVKKETGRKVKDWVFNKLWSLFEKWGHIKQHFEDVEIETFDFTESKKKKITDRILEEIRKREEFHRDRIMPDTHVVVIGEETFFEILSEKNNHSPFFSDFHTFLSNDVYYNDPYRGRRVMQFSCHVVNGMEGFAIIPKVIVEVKKG